MKEISLSRDSYHSKVYEKVTGMKPPMSLCPYFWIWMSIIVFSPFILLYKGLKFIHSKTRKHSDLKELEPNYWEKKDRRREFWMSLGQIAKWILIISIGGLLITGIVLKIIDSWQTIITMTWDDVLNGLINVGIVLLTAVSVCFVGYLISKIWKFTFNPENRFMGFMYVVGDKINKILNIIGSMIYATYKKSCPIIRWK